MFQLKAGKFELSYGSKSAPIVPTIGSSTLIPLSASDLAKYFSALKDEGSMLTMFQTIPEVFAPVDLIADSVASAKWQLRKLKRGAPSDEIVENYVPWNKFVDKPNWLETLYDLIYKAVVYELCCGNRYHLPYIPSTLPRRFENIVSYHLLEPQFVNIYPKSAKPKFYMATSAADVIDRYEYNNHSEVNTFTPEQVTHEAYINFSNGNKWTADTYKGFGPLQSCEYPMAGLMHVYEALDVIYVNRGSMGFVVTEQSDADGRHALTPAEKKELLKEFHETHGLTKDKSVIGISRFPLSWVKITPDIKSMMPMEIMDKYADAILDALRLPRELKARAKGATFENQREALARAYRAVFIPKAESLAQVLTKILGLDKEGYYIHAGFDHVEVLQENQKEKAENDSILNATCKEQFYNGIITLNQWRVKLGEEETPNALYDKLIYDMTPEELEKVKAVTNLKSVKNEQGNETQSGQGSAGSQQEGESGN